MDDVEDSDLAKTLQRSAKGSVVLVGGQFLSTLVTAIGVIIVSRLLGSAPLGVATKAVIPYSIATLFIDFGVNAALIRNIAQLRATGQRNLVKPLVQAALIFELFMSSILACIVYLSAGFIASDVYHDPVLKPLIQVTALGIIGTSATNSAHAIFTGYERMGLRSLTQVVYSFIKSVMGPVLVYIGLGPLGAILGQQVPFVVSGALGLSMVLMLLRKSPSPTPYTGILERIRMLLEFGLPLFVSSLLLNGRNRILSTILPFYVPDTHLGDLAASQNFSVLVGFFSIPITTSLFPLFSKFDHKNGRTLGRIFQTSVKYACLIIFPVTVAVIVLSQNIVDIIYPGQFQNAPYFIKLYMLTYFLAGIGNIGLAILLNSQQETQTTFRVRLIQFVVGVIVGLLLIPMYGVPGRLVTMVLSPIPGLLYGLWWVNTHFGFSINLKDTGKMYISSTVTYLVVFTVLNFIKLDSLTELFIGGILVVILFFLLILLFKVVDKSDFDTISILTKGLGPLTPIIHKILDLILPYISG
jgi:O-antigen/teichoic acid export membrane protein